MNSVYSQDSKSNNNSSLNNTNTVAINHGDLKSHTQRSPEDNQKRRLKKQQDNDEFIRLMKAKNLNADNSHKVYLDNSTQ